MAPREEQLECYLSAKAGELSSTVLDAFEVALSTGVVEADEIDDVRIEDAAGLLLFGVGHQPPYIPPLTWMTLPVM